MFDVICAFDKSQKCVAVFSLKKGSALFESSPSVIKRHCKNKTISPKGYYYRLHFHQIGEDPDEFMGMTLAEFDAKYTVTLS